jgi:phosphoenolpyruvate carboxykinase (GTP)
MSKNIEKWVNEVASLLKPDKIYWCNGSEEEAKMLIERGINEEKLAGKPVFSKLNDKRFPNSYLHNSDTQDVARTEHLTFVCHRDKETTGPNNNWMDPNEAKKKMTELSTGAMKGRTMYVLPYMMGDINSPYAKPCIQVTDSVYVAVSMRIMARVSNDVIKKIGDSNSFIKGIHSVGDLDPNRRFIMHFPEDKLVWSIGSGYGGNALLGKKCIALRIASDEGRHESWLAEHMIVVGIETPAKEIFYILAALPSACGKTNLAMMQSALPGYKIWTLGDDIAWLNIGEDGKLYAINPENGFFGVVPGTSMSTNPNMMRTLENDKFFPTLFTNVGLDVENNEPWWEDMGTPKPNKVLDWKGDSWDENSGKPAAHPNSRFTVSIANCPTLSKEINNPKGVPISAIIFGTRRTSLIPLVVESPSWSHGVFTGSRMGSETTAAATSAIGVIRRDPMAMLPFCGYNMADYFAHWLSMGDKIKHQPKIFSVNWFRKDEKGKFMWPGFGENIRIIKWMIDRVKNNVLARETAIGLVPKTEDIDVSGLNISKEVMHKLFEVNIKDWKDEVNGIEEFYNKFGNKMPKGILEEFQKLKELV